jgi:hypothetical protein
VEHCKVVKICLFPISFTNAPLQGLVPVTYSLSCKHCYSFAQLVIVRHLKAPTVRLVRY